MGAKKLIFLSFYVIYPLKLSENSLMDFPGIPVF